MDRRAKIVATLGPATADERMLDRLLAAGADVLRFNLSHGNQDSHRRALRLVRKVARARGLHIPVLLDLMGPRYRLGELSGGPRQLRQGEHLTLGEPSPRVDLPVDDPDFLHHLRVGERVLIDNGLVELEITAKRGQAVAARVLHGGAVSTRKGINLPDSKLPFTISEKDASDIAFAVAEHADYIAASYIGRARDIAAIRAIVARHGAAIPIVAKLERAAAIAHIDEIVAASDAVMVARGDLGVEVPLHEVPVLQKRIIAAGRRLGKPVIVATQMLESMMVQPRPTRAETSDVANAVFDGADALMLSGETAAGRYPTESVKTMARIIVEAEDYKLKTFLSGEVPRDPALPAGRFPAPAPRTLAPAEGLDPGTDTGAGVARGAIEIADVIAAAAVHAASKLDGSRIVAFSQGGFTARRLARYRPVVPTFVFTTDAQVARRIQLLWGMRPIHLPRDVQHREDLIEIVERELLERRLVRPGECVILLMGFPIRQKALTNLLRIHRVREQTPGRMKGPLRAGNRPR
ncbi:MAG: pyruvate kinase [Acidobacteriota bacterium]|nr:pyruvate kinase [Acidobacteriota bacterium]